MESRRRGISERRVHRIYLISANITVDLARLATVQACGSN
jgi:hypothetical protein